MHVSNHVYIYISLSSFYNDVPHRNCHKCWGVQHPIAVPAGSCCSELGQLPLCGTALPKTELQGAAKHWNLNGLVVFSLLLVASLLDSFFGYFFDHWIFVWSIGAVGDSQYPVNPVLVSVKNEHIGSYQHVVSLLQMFGSTLGPWSQLQQPSVFGIVRRCKTWDASPMYAYFDLTYLNYHEFSRMLSQSRFFAHSERSSHFFPSFPFHF